jgi:hypothetical protein
MGCGARAGGAGSGAQGTSDAATVPEGGGVRDSGVPGIAPSDGRPMDDQGSVPPDLLQGPTVWIGQTDAIVTYPADYDGGAVVPYNDAPFNGAGGPEKVVLILDAMTNPLLGTITFGDIGPPPPATDPNQPYPPAPTMLQDPNGQRSPLVPGNWVQWPFPGFSYSLVASTLSGNLLQLAFVPPQLWQGWCAVQDSSTQGASVSSAHPSRPCLCDAGACTAMTSPQLHLTLTISGDTMQGQFLRPSFCCLPGGPPQIRLQRVQ